MARKGITMEYPVAEITLPAASIQIRRSNPVSDPSLIVLASGER